MRTDCRYPDLLRWWIAALLIASAQFCWAGAGQSNPVAPPVNISDSPGDDGIQPVPIRLAQARTNGDLYVEVTDDEGGALPGATVTVSARGGAPQIQITNAQGRASFRGLDIGSYKMKTELDGFATVQYPNVEIKLGASTSVDVAISPAVEETITVTSESPLLDERKVRTGTSISSIELERIPTARDPWSVLQNTPGVQVDRINVGGDASGTGTAENTFMIDGVEIPDVNTVDVNPTYYDFSQLEGAFSDAGSLPSTTGLALAHITKRGTNQWRGSGKYFSAEDGHIGGSLEQSVPNTEPGGFLNQRLNYDDYLTDREQVMLWARHMNNSSKLLWDSTPPFHFVVATGVTPDGGFRSGVRVADGATSPGDAWTQAGGEKWDSSRTTATGFNPERQYFFIDPVDAVRREYQFGTAVGTSARAPTGLYRPQFLPVTINGTLGAIGGIGFDRGMFTHPVLDWEWLLPTATAQAPSPTSVSMLQVPMDATFEQYGISYGESEGPKLVHGADVKMPNAAWDYPGDWQTIIAVGPDQATAFVTAPEWLSGESVFMADDTVINAKTKASAAELAQAAWKSASAGPDGDCQPVFDADADHPAQRWMLLRARLSDRFVRLFALNLGGAGPHWAELDADGRAHRFGSGLRYDPAAKLLWLIGGTTDENRRAVYTVQVPVLGLRWLSLTDPSSAFDVAANPFKLCIGPDVAAPDQPAAATGAAAQTPQPAKLAACKQVKKVVPKNIVAAALAAPDSVPGHGQTCYPAAPPLAPNPERSKLSLRIPGRPYHPLYNPLAAVCDCSAGI